MKSEPSQSQPEPQKPGKPRAPGDAQVASCPACGAKIKASPAARNRRVQCPKCREIVVLEMPAAKNAPAVTVPQPASDTATEQQRRIESLEARVAALEKALADATRTIGENIKAPMTQWQPGESPPEFSTAQAELLRDHLRIIQPHRITIQFPSDNAPARERAEWFRDVFERARWRVSGPETARVVSAKRELALASCLPVSAEVAATYQALRAAGFQPVAEFDPDLNETEERLIVA